MLALFVALGVVLVTGLAIPAFADKVKSYRSEDRNFYTLGPNQAFKDAVGENPEE